MTALKETIDSRAYCLERGRFHPEIGTATQDSFFFAPEGVHFLDAFDADFLPVVQDAFCSLLTGFQTEMQIYCYDGYRGKKARSALGENFSSSYARFLAAHQLYGGRYRLEEDAQKSTLTLYAKGGDRPALSAYFDHCLTWPYSTYSIEMRCRGILRSGAEFERPDICLFCSDVHPALNIEVSKAVAPNILIERLEKICHKHGKVLSVHLSCGSP